MKKELEEAAFALSVTASCFPFIFLVFSFFETAEPYNYLVFLSYVIEGCLVGSILGILALIGNRHQKRIKTYILALFPICLLFLALIVDSVYSRNMP